MAMSEAIEREGYRGGAVAIHYDEDGESADPRQWTNLSRLVFAPHRNYTMPNEIDFDFDAHEYDEEDGGLRPGEGMGAWALRTLRERHGALYIVSVFMIDHSGVAYRVGRSFADIDPGEWDSGQCGWAIVTAESAAECGTAPGDFPAVVAGEVSEYSEWANGQVFYWTARDDRGDVIESCGGYIGDESFADMLAEARAAVDQWADEREETADNLAADAIAALVHG